MKKYSKKNNKNQRKRIKNNKNSENKFLRSILGLFKKQLGNISGLNINETINKLKNVNLNSLDKVSKRFGFNILKNNRKGFGNIIKAMSYGSSDKEREKKFSKAIPSLIKEKKIYAPYISKFQENIKLIKDVPEEVADKLKEAYEKGQGLRGTDIEKFIEQKMKKRARVIIRTESSKINSALTEVRAKSFGLVGYFWSTSGDVRVRETHKMMDNVLLFYDDPPVLDGFKGHAGEFINCRCVPLPVFSMNEIQFPVKVCEHLIADSKYIKGSHGKYEVNIKMGEIKKYTKKEFINKYGVRFK